MALKEERDEDLEDEEQDEDENNEEQNDEESPPKESAEHLLMPILQGQNVIEIQINGNTLPLLKPVDYKEFYEELLPMLIKLQGYINLTHLITNTSKRPKNHIVRRPWTTRLFKDFWEDISEKYQTLIKIVYENEELERVDLMNDLVKAKILVKDANILKNFSGIAAGLSRKINNKGFEMLWKVNSEGTYILKEDIKDIISPVLEAES